MKPGSLKAMAPAYGLAGRGLGSAALAVLVCIISGAGSWNALLAHAGFSVLATTLFFDAAVLGIVVLSVVGLLLCTGIVAALLLGVWGEDLMSNLKRMGGTALRGALLVSPVAAAWAYAMVHLEALSVRWSVFVCLLAIGGAAVCAVAGQIFTLVIVRVLIMPACLPAKLFSMITGMPEDHLDRCRETMTTDHGWEPLAVAPEGGAQVDAMLWSGYKGKTAAPGRWVIWFLGNGARYEECHCEMEEYAQHLGVSVVAFNYRGVGRSTGLAWAFDDLVVDGKAVLAALCEHKRLKPEDVLLHGHSLGGAVSSLVRADSPGGLLINDRSFGALSEVPVAWVRRLSEHAGNPLPEQLFEAFCTLLPYLMTTMGWAAPINEQWAANPDVVKRTLILVSLSSCTDLHRSAFSLFLGHA